jgi:predicted nucleotidyltransferase
MSSFSVLSSQKRQVMAWLTERLLCRPEILFALLHGSFVRDGPFRDVDVALYSDPALLGAMTFREYEIDLGVRLSGNLGVSVDIRVLNDAPVAFRYHALQGLVLFARDENTLDDFRARTWDEYCDFAPFSRQYLREVMGG